MNLYYIYIYRNSTSNLCKKKKNRSDEDELVFDFDVLPQNVINVFSQTGLRFMTHTLTHTSISACLLD